MSTIPTLTVFTGQTPNKATQTKEQFADNIYATHLFYDNTFVGEMNTIISGINSNVSVLNNQLVYSNYAGDYSPTATYSIGQSVTYLGNIWYSKIAGNVGNTPVEGTNWTKPSGIVASVLQTARTINGVSFDGSSDINIEDRMGVSIASAATTIVGTAGLGETIHITGTTTITSFGTTVAGTRRTLIFDGALTITHNATSLICIGGVNIVTVAGTVIELIAETASNWRVISVTHPSVSMDELGYLDGVTSSIQTQLNAKIGTSGATMTGAITSLRETKISMAANDINLATGNLFTKTITTATTLTVSNIPTTGQAAHFVLELTNGGAFTITWFSGVKWASGAAPVLTASGVDILGFYSHDGGTTWRGIVMAKDSK